MLLGWDRGTVNAPTGQTSLQCTTYSCEAGSIVSSLLSSKLWDQLTMTIPPVDRNLGESSCDWLTALPRVFYVKHPSMNHHVKNLRF